MVFDGSNVNSLGFADYVGHLRTEVELISNKFLVFSRVQWVLFYLLFCFRKTGVSVLYGKRIITPFLVKESFIFWQC